jgi:hypothetical protein
MRELHEKLHYLYSSQNITGIIKAVRLKWVGGGHVVRKEEARNAYTIPIVKPGEKISPDM